jgi:hypothetical protein
MALPFASLTPTQQAQAAQIFQDAIFGSDPAAYAYELHADGQLTGQRYRPGPDGRAIAHDRKATHGKPHSPWFISTSGQLVLSDQNAQVFARLILPGLLNIQDAPSVPEAVALPVEAPSLPNSG